MIAQLQTPNETLMKIFKVPFIGAFLLILIILLPTQLLAMLIGYFIGWEPQRIQSLYLFMATAVSGFLWIRGTKFKILWVPLWVITAVFFVITLFGVKL